MILGKISGKTTTNNFKFLADTQVKKFEYVQVYHPEYDYVLCQIIEIEKENSKIVADCIVIGYKEGKLVKKPRIPLDTDSEVLLAEDDFIRDIIKLDDSESGAYIGKLDGKDIDIHLDLNKVLTMHMAVLAKSGSGKSYAVGVLLEEMLERNIPLVVIDPHGEYTSLKYKNDNEDDIKRLAMFGLEPKAYKVQEYGDPTLIEGVRPLRLSKKITQEELLHLIPGKLSNSQLAILYSAMKNLGEWNFESLLLALDMEENNAKWSVMSLIDSLRSTEIFSDYPISYNELISPGKTSILNLKGINPDVQELIVYKLCKDLFELRKKNKVPPFFLVIEEAHNYCPERSFGETKASKLLRNIASEGRKFGLGLCVISQRPARVDKSILSQCSTQFILKVTNPNDLKALGASVEGLTSSTEKEIQNIPIGTALITGLTEVPLFVNVRPRRSMHGGRAEKIVNNEEKFLDKMKDFEEEELLPIIKPNTTLKDLALMSENEVKDYIVSLIPCYQFVCKDSTNDFKLLVDMRTGDIIVDKEELTKMKIPDLSQLNPKQIKILKFAFQHKQFEDSTIIKELGTNVDIVTDLDILENLGFLKKSKFKYVLNEEYIFSKLSKVQNFDKINFENVSYDEKIEPEVNLDQLIEKLSRFTSISDKSECFLIRYKLL